MREKALSDTVWGVLFILITLFLLLESTRAIGGYGWYRYSNLMWPRIVIAIMLLFSLILTIRGLWNLKHIPHEESKRSEDTETENLSRVWQKLLIAGLFYAAYVFVVPWLGFILSTLLMMAANMLLLGERKWLRIASVAFVTSVAFVLLFGQLIGVDFPRGVSFLRQLSFIFY